MPGFGSQKSAIKTYWQIFNVGQFASGRDEQRSAVPLQDPSSVEPRAVYSLRSLVFSMHLTAVGLPYRWHEVEPPK